MKELSSRESVACSVERADGTITETDEEICEELNKEFQSVFTAENIPPPHIAEMRDYGPVIEKSVFSAKELCNALMELTAHKAMC
ncbi:hypothetical protein SK128_015559 [Halocaridina rubra]|uniref:Uncharacterized protein n=1 Tax=Halocaridina rubra TaxID=373956 RepID=A0AAN8X768_HALRR